MSAARTRHAAGHLPQPADGPLIVGKVGRELTTEQGAEAAKAVMLNILATLKGARRRGCAARVGVVAAAACDGRCALIARSGVRLCVSRGCAHVHSHAVAALPGRAAELGSLDKVKRVVKLTAFVNCVDGFAAQPKVANGASELLGAVFGEKGAHARSAVGTNSLPLNVPVEIEAIVEVL